MKRFTIVLAFLATQATAGSVTCMDLGYGMVSCSNGASAMTIAPGLTTFNYPTPAPSINGYQSSPAMPIMPVMPIAPLTTTPRPYIPEYPQSNSIPPY